MFCIKGIGILCYIVMVLNQKNIYIKRTRTDKTLHGNESIITVLYSFKSSYQLNILLHLAGYAINIVVSIFILDIYYNITRPQHNNHFGRILCPFVLFFRFVVVRICKSIYRHTHLCVHRRKHFAFLIFSFLFYIYIWGSSTI